MKPNPGAHTSGGAATATMSELTLSIPRGHVGPYFMAGIGKMIWWTGRVAIGLRYEPLARVSNQGSRSTPS